MLALLPLGILSMVMTRDAVEQVDITTLDGVGGAALKAVRTKVDLIKEAQISARTLARIIVPDVNDAKACSAQVKAIAADIPEATLVAFIPLSGLMSCSSTGQVFDFKDNPRFQQLVETPKPRLIYNPNGPVSGMAIVGISHPVLDAAGALLGVVSVSLPYETVAPDAYVDTVASWRPSYIATFQTDGSVLLSSDPTVAPESVVPGGITAETLMQMADRSTYFARPDGRHILSVVSITGDLFLVSVWRRDVGTLLAQANGVTAYLLPGLTWVSALVAAAFASSRLVVRHVRALTRSMGNYVATQTRAMIPDLAGAPDEIQRLHASYEALIRTIEQEEAELQNLLVDKEILLREVNHRSGNSLQVIASIMRMYRREAADPKLQAVLDSLINRVITLSSAHTSLYALSGQRDVAIDVVLTNVILRLKEIHGVALGVAAKRFQPIRMEPQAGIPLALALAEAIGCFFTRPDLARDDIMVALTEDQGDIRLEVAGPDVPELRAETKHGLLALPQRMLRHFAAQLSGQITVVHEEGRVRVELRFPRPAPGADFKDRRPVDPA